MKRKTALAAFFFALAMSTQAFAGVVAFSGDVALVQLPPSFSALTSNYYAFLFKERSGYVIPDFPAINPLIPPGREFLSVSTPGNYGLDPRIPRHLPPGTVVDTYVLYFDPIGENIFSWSASGAFSFDQEILGIQLDNQYSLIGEILDLPGLETSQFNSWLEPSDCVSEPDICDSFTLSADLRTITFDFRATSSQDPMRIFVAVPEPATVMLFASSFALFLVLLRRRAAVVRKAAYGPR